MAVVDALAGILRRINAIPVCECPFTGDHTFRLNLARQRIDAGLVDEDDFDTERLDSLAGVVITHRAAATYPRTCGHAWELLAR